MDENDHVTPVRAGSEIDKSALFTYLAKNVLGRTSTSVSPFPTFVIQQFSHGQSNPTYLVTITQRNEKGNTKQQLVIRKKPAGVTIPSAHAVDREYAVMKALYTQASFPVPRVFALEDTGTVLKDNSPFYVMEYVEGRIFTNPTLPSLNTAQRREVYQSAINTLAKLHSLDPGVIGLGSFGPPTTSSSSLSSQHSGYYSRQIRRLAAVSMEQSKHAAPLPRLADAIKWFTSPLHAIPQEDIPRVVHGDYKIDNLIFGPSAVGRGRGGAGGSSSFPSASLEVLAVLDWEMSTLGHPLADLANMCGAYYIPALMMEKEKEEEEEEEGAKKKDSTKSKRPPSSSGMAGLMGADLGWDISGIPTETELVDAYCIACNLPPLPAGHFDYVMAFWFFKYATIAQGVAARAARGVASSAQAKQVGQMAPLLMEMCLSRAGI